MNNTTYDLIILGSGPSGLTAAIYASRAHVNTLVIGGNPPGGQLMWTTDVENFPGFPEGIMGPELIGNMRAQAERFGSTFVDQNAEKVRRNDDGTFEIATDEGEKYFSKSVIVATGASAKWLNLESEQRLRAKGVSACATCDGFFFRDKVVAVVGAGDSAMEEATYLTKFASKVYVLVRKAKEEMRASKYMIAKAEANEKIHFLYNTEVVEVLGDEMVIGLKVLNNASSEEAVLEDVQGLFVAIGHVPNTGFLKELIEVESNGYAKATDNVCSNVEGLFIAGDVYDYKYRQAITAAGFGCMAALEAERYLSEKYGD